MQPNENKPKENPGYETSDVNVSGVLVFLTALVLFIVVFFVFCYGMGKAINYALDKKDGPTDKWHSEVNTKTLGNMATNPEMQQKLAQMTQQFPTPRLQTDDGNQDVADLHAREDLLLENYSWADQSAGKVRIPIDVAMKLIAERGLPVAKAPATTSPLLTGETKPVVTEPLTNGFARTAYEQEQMEVLRKSAGK
jgi:hypothetical protein